MIDHTQLKVRCKEFSLHFIICTWDPKKHEGAQLHCPECGQKSGWIKGSETFNKPIYMIV